MAFRPLEFSALVQRAPRKASAALSNHYAAHGTAAAVAAELGVGVRTLKRWLQAVTAAGYPLRAGTRPRRGWPPGKQRGPKIALNFKGRKKKLRDS